MVAIISSHTLGVSGTSLGQRGSFGTSTHGNNGEQVSTNIANGNLVLQNHDDVFQPRHGCRGLRTYNSQGLMNDDNGDGAYGTIRFDAEKIPICKKQGAL